MEALIAIGVVMLLMLIGVPVVYSFIGMTAVLSFMYDIDVSTLMTTGFWSINSLILIALPLFIMTGYLMQAGGIATRLIQFVEVFVFPISLFSTYQGNLKT